MIAIASVRFCQSRLYTIEEVKSVPVRSIIVPAVPINIGTSVAPIMTASEDAYHSNARKKHLNIIPVSAAVAGTIMAFKCFVRTSEGT